MYSIDIDDVCNRLLEVMAYDITLSQRMPHEMDFPEDVVPFLVERLMSARSRCENATTTKMPDAVDELGHWLVKSYEFYLHRLLEVGNPWVFRLPSLQSYSQHEH